MGKDDLPVTFGEWLKQQRRRLDLTQEELAQRAGCSVFALRKIEAGERRPSKQLAGLLANALGVPPDEQETFCRVARGERSIERIVLPVDSSLHPQIQEKTTARPSPLPIPATHLVGREAELAAIERIFRQPHCRLLTLTGPGGIGKTRLAIEYASAHSPSFPSGVYYVSLASLESAKLIIPTIADAVGFSFSGPGELKEQLFRYLRDQIKQPALFVLDNVEHLLEPAPNAQEDPCAPDVVAEMLQNQPDIKILATSRERLNLHGEWMYELHGLAVPSGEMIWDIENYSAVALFVQSARQAISTFTVTDEDRQAISRICKFVDGIPLAIELAAAWVGVLSCAEIAREMEVNIDLLTTTMRDVPRRHRSIRAAFDHSWNLLREDERRVLQRLSVFRGGFYRDAAAQVADASLPLLASLVSKSLLRRTESGRYDLHEVIRQYAYSHLLANPDGHDTHERHCLYYLAVLRDRQHALKTAGQQEALRELLDEMENIRMAWAWAIEHRQYAAILPAGRGFAWLFEVAGLLNDGIELFELLVQGLRKHPRDQEADRLLAEALSSQSLLYFRKGELNQALSLLEESVAILRAQGAPSTIPDPFVYAGIILHLNGELDRSLALINEGLAYARAIGDRWFEAYAIYNLGFIASLIGEYEQGYEQMVDALAIWRSLGDPHYIALGLNFLSPTLIKLGRYQNACESLEESIHLCAVTGNRWGEGNAYRFLGIVYIDMGRYAEAGTLFRKSLDIFSGIVHGYDIAITTIHLAEANMLEGNFSEAKRLFIEGLRLSIDAVAVPQALSAILGLSQIQAEAGECQSALEYACFVYNHSKALPETKECAGRLCSQMEKGIAADQVESARMRAQEHTLESIAGKLTGS